VDDVTGAIRIDRFNPLMQDAFRSLVLDGMAQRWGSADPTLMPDLYDVDARYVEDVVLVALDGEQVVGTGILVLRPGAGEIVRLSVHRDHRRKGIATRLVSALIELAGVHGVEQVVVETNAKWTDAQALYEGVGFTLTHYAPGDFGREAFYKLDL
jgi:GNAT superfamily N-acetyltransferase